MKRFNLVLPNELYESVRDVSDKQFSSVTEVIKQYIVSGLNSEKSMRKRKIRINDTQGSMLFVVDKIVSWNTSHTKFLYIHANSETFKFIFSDAPSLNEEVRKLESVFK